MWSVCLCWCCVCMSVSIHCTCACMHAYGGRRLISCVFFNNCSLYFLRQDLLLSLVLIGWPASSQDPPVCLPTARTVGVYYHARLLNGCRGFDVSPHVCTSSTLTSDTSPLCSPLYFCSIRSYSLEVISPCGLVFPPWWVLGDCPPLLHIVNHFYVIFPGNLMSFWTVPS